MIKTKRAIAGTFSDGDVVTRNTTMLLTHAARVTMTKDWGKGVETRCFYVFGGSEIKARKGAEALASPPKWATKAIDQRSVIEVVECKESR